MNRPSSIPVWEFSEMNTHHFGQEEIPPAIEESSPRFYICRLRDTVNKIKFPLPPHRKPMYDFLYVTQGSTKRGKALTKYEVKPHEFFFLPAYQITEHNYVSEDLDGFYCHFSLDIFAEWINPEQLLRKFPFLQFNGLPVVPVNENGRPRISNLLECLETIQKENSRFDLAAAYLLSLFTEVQHNETGPELSTKDTSLRITELYKDALSRNIYENHLVSDYADMLHITPNHLNKCVKKAMGISAQELLNRMLLLEAKVLLSQTDKPISDIAYQLSKKNPSDFSRFFKSKMGTTPKEYRNS
jgi:AraC-like DNA-binding protein